MSRKKTRRISANFVSLPDGYKFGEICFKLLHKLPRNVKMTPYEYAFANNWLEADKQIMRRMFGLK